MPSELGISIQGPHPPSSNYATPVIRNSMTYYAFDGSTSESLVWQGILPAGYDGGGITVDIYAMATTATSGDYVWSAAFERGNTDLDSDSFATAKNATTTTSGTSGIITKTSIVFSNSEIDGLEAGEPFRFKLARLPADAADTITTDIQLFAISLRET